MFNRSPKISLGFFFSAFFFLYIPPSIAGEANLSWNQNNESDLAGYKIFVGITPGDYGPPIDIGNRTAYLVTGLANGTYYFAVKAYDFSGNLSNFSNEVSKTISGSSVTPISQGGGSGINSSGSSAGGCGFIRTSHPSRGNPIEFAMYIVPLFLLIKTISVHLKRRFNPQPI